MQKENYSRIHECMRLHELCSLFLIPVDEIKRYMAKSFNELRGKVHIFIIFFIEFLKKFETYFEENFEMESIITDLLKDDKIFKKFQEIVLKEHEAKAEERQNFLFNYNLSCDENFPILKNINKNKILLVQEKEVALKNPAENRQENYENIINMHKEFNQFDFSTSLISKQKNLKEEDDLKRMLETDTNASFLLESLLECDSFRKNDYLSKISNFQSFVSLKKLKDQENTSHIKDLRLNSKTFYTDFASDHRPKIMTTNKCEFLISF